MSSWHRTRWLFCREQVSPHGVEPVLVRDTVSVTLFAVHAEIRADDLINSLQAELLIGGQLILADPADVLRIPEAEVDHFTVAGFDVSVYIGQEGKTVTFFAGLKVCKAHPDMVLFAEKTISAAVVVFGINKDPFKTDSPLFRVDPFYPAFKDTVGRVVIGLLEVLALS